MIQELLKKEEGKTLEFKENASSLLGIIKTIVAFANTAGGTLVIGVEDKTKKIVGLVDPLEDEMRIINKIADSVVPLLTPNIEIQTYRKKAIILVQVPFVPCPYQVRKEGQLATYVRFGSSNRIADEVMVDTIKSLARNMTFDERPCAAASKNELDWQAIQDIFEAEQKKINQLKAKSIGIITTQIGNDHPSNGGVILFGKNRSTIFPDAIVRCVRFSGITRGDSIDHKEVDAYLPKAVDELLHFIRKNSLVKTKIGSKTRVEKTQYPTVAVREAVINALIHTDYAIKGSSILVAMFDDRLEITNPGGIPHGLSLEDALAGSSRARNRVIIRTFHLLDLVEQWGSGLQKIIDACVAHGLKQPMFEELGSQFRVTMFAAQAQKRVMTPWETVLIDRLRIVKKISAQDAALLWKVDVRTARRRLTKLVDEGSIAKQATSKTDPHGIYVLCG